jgi:sugar (pentulose or hexulose) kinase
VGSLINVGKKLFFAKKHFPQGFARIDSILNYPQYFGYLFTGKKGAEPTYVGCHTYLFDFDKKEYSSVARKLGIVEKLPPVIARSWEVLGTVTPRVAAETGLPPDCVVTMGIHDSNSSLLPYLVKGHGNFVLNSTGTWCVAMHPAAEVPFRSKAPSLK